MQFEILTGDAGAGVLAAQDFVGAAICAGIKQDDVLDMVMIHSLRPAAAAATITQNVFRAAPTYVTEEAVADGYARTIIVNSGNANCATGSQGLRDARRMGELAAELTGVAVTDTIVCSTGRIGVPLPMDKVEAGLRKVAGLLSREDPVTVARGILTTDTVEKISTTRFTVPADQCPVIASEWEDPRGVPISAILFGGRRASAVPLVTEAFDWAHGVFMASNVASEGTAAAENKIGELRRDPFAMLPFCGYHMGDYFAHWLKLGERADASKLPRIFFVNWFRKDARGRYVWPGYGENSRVLKWIVDRIEGRAQAVDTAIGRLPTAASLDVGGLDMAAADLDLLLSVDAAVWREEAALIGEAYEKFGDRLPAELSAQLAALGERLAKAEPAVVAAE